MKPKNLFFPLLIIAPILLLLPSGLHAQNDEFQEPPLWRQAMGGEVIGKPVAQVESVVMVTDGGNLKSFSSAGTPLWSFFARGRLTPLVSRSREGTSYVCRTNGLLIAVNRSGRELWRINLGAVITHPVLTGWDGRLFVFTDKKVSCFTAAGYMLWSRTLESGIRLAPIRDSAGGIIIVQDDSKLLRLNAFGNVFSLSLGAVPAAAASLSIEGWGNSILLLYADRHIELVYPSLGYSESLRGQLDLPAAPLAAIGRGGEAAVLLRDGKIALIDPVKRKTLWTGATHIMADELGEISGGGKSDLLFDERGIYALTRRGATGFAADGRRLWFMRLTNAAALPAFGDDGILYSGAADWILYSYRIEDRVRAKQRLLYGEAPEGSYGAGSPGPSSYAEFPFRFSDSEMSARFSEIRAAIKDGAIGSKEKEYTALLMETAGSALVNSEVRPAHIRHRVEAARLLAYMGSQETIPFLADLFNRDPDNLVKAAAAEAIGKIGVDPEGRAMRAFENAVYPPFLTRDENVLTAVAAATGALCRFSGPPLSDAGVKVLTILSTDDKPAIVKRRAQREMRSL